MKKLIFSALVATVVCISSCSKEGDGGGSSNGLPGTLYVDFATDGIQSYNFSNGKYKIHRPSYSVLGTAKMHNFPIKKCHKRVISFLSLGHTLLKNFTKNLSFASHLTKNI